MTKPKLEFASTKKIDQLHKEISEIMWQIASMMKEPDESEEEWLQYAFVSDESRLIEFLFEESEVLELRDRLKLPTLDWRDLFIDVALALRHKRA